MGNLDRGNVLLELVVDGNRLLAQRDQPEDMPGFGAVFLIEVIDDCGVCVMGTLVRGSDTIRSSDKCGGSDKKSRILHRELENWRHRK